MTRGSFDEELKLLHHDLLKMGSVVEKQIDDCINSLKNQDEELAGKVIENDDIVDKMETDIEERCVKLIARQQPLAIDLRKIFSTIKIVTDLERIADHAVDMAKVTLRLKDEKYIKPLIDIPRISGIVQSMIKDSLDAYVNLDTDKSALVCKRDDEIDTLYKQIFSELLVIMMQDPTTITQATQFLFVSKFLERIGDHVTNICEWTIYLVTGEYSNLND
jgi:phosphate transport system regulatory protein PhoU